MPALRFIQQTKNKMKASLPELPSQRRLDTRLVVPRSQKFPQRTAIESFTSMTGNMNVTTSQPPIPHCCLMRSESNMTAIQLCQEISASCFPVSTTKQRIFQTDTSKAPCLVFVQHDNTGQISKQFSYVRSVKIQPYESVFYSHIDNNNLKMENRNGKIYKKGKRLNVQSTHNARTSSQSPLTEPKKRVVRYSISLREILN